MWARRPSAASSAVLEQAARGKGQPNSPAGPRQATADAAAPARPRSGSRPRVGLPALRRLNSATQCLLRVTGTANGDRRRGNPPGRHSGVTGRERERPASGNGVCCGLLVPLNNREPSTELTLMIYNETGPKNPPTKPTPKPNQSKTKPTPQFSSF